MPDERMRERAAEELALVFVERLEQPPRKAVSAPTRLDQLCGLNKHKASLERTCSCRPTHGFDAARLHRYALLRSWSTTSDALGRHPRCRNRRLRNPYFRSVPHPPTRSRAQGSIAGVVAAYAGE